jgi:hypothetical protein
MSIYKIILQDTLQGLKIHLRSRCINGIEVVPSSLFVDDRCDYSLMQSSGLGLG